MYFDVYFIVISVEKNETVYNDFSNVFKYVNYLIKYARYENVPSTNEFYGKN